MKSNVLSLYFSLLILATAVFHIAAAHALQPVSLNDSPNINISPFLDYLEDPTGRFTLLEVLNPAAQAHFLPVNDSHLHFGITRSTYWFRFQLMADASANLSGTACADKSPWLLEIDRAWMPVMTLWAPVKQKSRDFPGTSGVSKERWRELSAFTADKSKQINLLHRTSLFFIPDDYDENRPFYLKIGSWGPPLNFSLRLLRLHHFIDWQIWDFAIFGIIYGLILAMILYNACLYFSLRDGTYLIYVFYMAANLVYQVVGLGQVSAVTGIRCGENFYVIYVFSGAAAFFAAWFCRVFLLTKRNAPLMDRALKAYMGLACVWILMAFGEFYYYLQIFSSAVSATFPIVAIAAGIVCFARGVRPAGYFLTAWSVLSVGILIWAFRSMGMLPQTPLITYSYPLAVAAEAILLSLALADRIRVLQEEKRQMETRERRLLVLSNTDGLTKLYNKRYFDEKLKNEIALVKNLGDPLSLLILDLDNFKKINDTHGHPVGDQVLLRLGEIVQASIRETDCACRYGGEEFAVILPGTDREKSVDVAERIRQAMAADIFETSKGNKFSVTVSIGLGQYITGETCAELIRRTDQALYQAKGRGKNQAVAV